MKVERKHMYRLPWSKTDNPGGWVEVTDQCNLACPGCYRKTLEGHRPLDEVKKDILACREISNCDGIAISGGEPLIYPHIVEVVDFIARHRLKPIILTNGMSLTWELAKELKKAGLAKFRFHIDSGQQRPDWAGKTEGDMNALRERYADLLWELGGVQCGFIVVVSRGSLPHLPEVLEWCRSRIHKVLHLSLIALRGLPAGDDIEYQVNGRTIDLGSLPVSFSNLEEISITSEEMLEALTERFPDVRPCAYLSGTAAVESNKYFIIVHVGGRGKTYGVLGAKTMEVAQIFYHLFKGRYNLLSKTPKIGRKAFLLSPFDKDLRKALAEYSRSILKDPRRLFQGVYAQPIVLEQPYEVTDGEINLCDGCVNAMVYEGKLIPSCRLDEYRLFGGPVTPVRLNTDISEP